MLILVLVGVLGVLGVNTVRTYMSGAAADVEPIGVAAAAGEDGGTATISWTTNKAVQSVVEYGTTPASLLLRGVETDAATSHKLTITPLKANTSYYFRIRVGEEVFDNGGIPYSFKTKVSGPEAGGAKVSTAPVVTKALTTPGKQSCDKTSDYNKDGVVNTMDFVLCIKNGGATLPTPSGATGAGQCDNVDYDKNGVINSLDRIKCLQSGT